MKNPTYKPDFKIVDKSGLAPSSFIEKVNAIAQSHWERIKSDPRFDQLCQDFLHDQTFYGFILPETKARAEAAIAEIIQRKVS